MSEPHTRCYECGEELWGAMEGGGLCVMCQRAERAETDDQGDDHEDWDEPDDGAQRGEGE